MPGLSDRSRGGQEEMRRREINRRGDRAAGRVWASVALTALAGGWLATGIALADPASPSDQPSGALVAVASEKPDPIPSLSGFSGLPSDGVEITFIPIVTELPAPPPLEATGRTAAFSIVPTPGSGLLLIAGAGLNMRRVAFGKRRRRVAATLRGALTSDRAIPAPHAEPIAA